MEGFRVQFGDTWEAKKLDLPDFDGSNPVGWILRAERYFQFYGLKEEEKLEAAVGALEGGALLWHQFENGRRPIRDWAELRSLLLRQFRSTSTGRLQEQWLHHKFNEVSLYAPQMFDESPEKNYKAQIPPTPIYPPETVFKKNVFKLHEDERGKFEFLAETREHLCASEVFAKGFDKEHVLLCAARASRTENQDDIDAAIVGTLADPKEARAGIKEVHFLPFNSVGKRTA